MKKHSHGNVKLKEHPRDVTTCKVTKKDIKKSLIKNLCEILEINSVVLKNADEVKKNRDIVDSLKSLISPNGTKDFEVEVIINNPVSNKED